MGIEFTPSRWGRIRMEKDGTEITVPDQMEKDVMEGYTVLFKLIRWGPVHTLWSSMNVLINYDGNFVQVLPAPWVKGQHCGLCGNFDGNTGNELQDKAENAVSRDELVGAWCKN